MCPLSLQILNFPSADERILLWSVLPGPKKTKSLSTYLGPLVDQLLQLEEGVECYHSDSRERFKLKARCVCDILDYKGQQMFPNTLGQNAFQGCKKCQKPGTYLPIKSGLHRFEDISTHQSSPTLGEWTHFSPLEGRKSVHHRRR